GFSLDPGGLRFTNEKRKSVAPLARVGIGLSGGGRGGCAGPGKRGGRSRGGHRGRKRRGKRRTTGKKRAGEAGEASRPPKKDPKGRRPALSLERGSVRRIVYFLGRGRWFVRGFEEAGAGKMRNLRTEPRGRRSGGGGIPFPRTLRPAG